MNERGVAEGVFGAIRPGQLDYSDVIRKLQAAGIGVLYYAGSRQEAGLITRQARDADYSLQLVAGDGIGGEDFALIAGPAADGTLMSYAPGPLGHPEAARLAERFAAEGYAGSFGLGRFAPMRSSSSGRRRSSGRARLRPVTSRRPCIGISSKPCSAGSVSTRRAA